MRKVAEIVGWIVLGMMVLGVFSIGNFNISYTAQNVSYFKFQTNRSMNPVIHVKKFISEL